MNKKLLITTSVFTVIILSGISAGLFGWGDKNPSLAPNRATIDAHQCAADGTCEMNNAKIGGDLTVGGKFQLECNTFSVQNSSNGDETCANAGYDFCVFQESFVKTTYYDSNSQSCAGNIQVETTYSKQHSCSQRLNIGRSCATVPQGAEPYKGDQESVSGISGALCCR